MTENWKCDHGKYADDYCEACESAPAMEAPAVTAARDIIEMVREHDRAVEAPAPASPTLADVLVGCANLLDTIKQEWGEAWSTWDQSIREGITAHLTKIYAEPLSPETQPTPTDRTQFEAWANAKGTFSNSWNGEHGRLAGIAENKEQLGTCSGTAMPHAKGKHLWAHPKGTDLAERCSDWLPLPKDDGVVREPISIPELINVQLEAFDRGRLAGREEMREEFIPLLQLPGCGHPGQYAYTTDGGKKIVCLVCEYEAAIRSLAPQPQKETTK